MRTKALQQKLDRLDEAYLYAETIDLTSDERRRDRLRHELTLRQIDKHSIELEQVDVEGNPGVRRTRVTARLRSAGAGLARSKAAAASVGLR